jgi:hypothetical protein
MTTPSKRVQMASETEEFLKNRAYELGATYNKEGSISILLHKIAQKELKIEKVKSETSKPELESGYLTIFRFKTVLNLIGILAILSEEIKKKEGNIYKVEVIETNKNLGYVECMIDIKENKIDELIKDCSNIRLSKIENFHEEIDEILLNAEPLIRSIENLTLLQAYQERRAYLGLNDSSLGKESLWSKLKEEKLFREISCNFGIKLSVTNKRGQLSKISSIIANHKILISSIKLSCNNNFKETDIELLLELKPNLDKINLKNSDKPENKGIYEAKIMPAIKALKDMNATVELLGVDLLEDKIRSRRNIL